MKKLLFVVNVDWFFVSHRLPIALEALKNGYEVHLACTFTDKKAELIELGIECHDLTFSRSGGSLIGELSSINSVRGLIKQINPEIVHAVTIKPVIYVGLSLQTIIKPPAFVAAISGLGYVFTANSVRAQLTKFVVSLLYKTALRSKRKMVIFQNSSDQLVLSEIVSLSSSESTLIKGSGADLSVYDYQPEPKVKRKVVSMACRLLRDKGVYQFVEAAKLIKKKRSDTEFWLIGSVDPGNPNSILQVEVDQWDQEGVVCALGHRTDIPLLFAKSNIVTLPSFYGEGVPKVLIEAAACGRAIVTTDNPGCRDAILDKQTGILVPIKDSRALTDAIITLLEDEDRRMAMGAKAREYAVKEFDVENVVLKHMEIYESIVVNSL